MANNIKLIAEKPTDFEKVRWGKKVLYKCYLKPNAERQNQVPTLVTEDMYLAFIKSTAKKVKIKGEIYTRNVLDDNSKEHLEMVAMAKEFKFVKKKFLDKNEVFIEKGYLCKKSKLRITEYKRDIIQDAILAVNYGPGKTAYIPTVFWNKLAVDVNSMPIGAPISLTGELRSRLYARKDGEDVILDNIAYEVNVFKIN